MINSIAPNSNFKIKDFDFSLREKGFNMHLNENHNSFCDFPKLVNHPTTTPSPTCLNANIKLTTLKQ